MRRQLHRQHTRAHAVCLTVARGAPCVLVARSPPLAAPLAGALLPCAAGVISDPLDAPLAVNQTSGHRRGGGEGGGLPRPLAERLRPARAAFQNTALPSAAQQP